MDWKVRLTSPVSENDPRRDTMSEAAPSLKVRTQQQTNNFVHGLKQSPVKRVLVNGLHMAFVNTTAAFCTEFLNFYLESRGLNQRRIALLHVPNPDKQEAINPRKRTF